MNTSNRIATGAQSDIYLWEGKVVKIFHEDVWENEAEWEASQQRLAFKAGLPVPALYEVTHARGRQALIMEYIKGPTLSQAIEADREHLDVYIRLLVDAQMEIQQKRADGFPKLQETQKQSLLYSKVLPEYAKRRLLKLLESLPYDNHLCHGKLHPSNLIQTKKGLYVLDWVNARAGTRAADAFRTYMLLTLNRQEMAERYLDRYCAVSGLERADILRWAPIVAGIQLSECRSEAEKKRLLDWVNGE